MTLLSILLSCLYIGIAAIIFYGAYRVIRWSQKISKDTEMLLQASRTVSGATIVGDFDRTWEDMNEIRRKAETSLAFPVLTPNIDFDQPQVTLDKLLRSVEFKSAALAGTEQLVLTFISPNTFPDFIEKSASAIAPHAESMKTHFLEALKEMKATAVKEWSSNSFSELGVKCLKGFFEGLKDIWHHISHLDLQGILILAKESETALFLNFHAISKALDPVLHTEAFVSGLKHHLGDHAHQVAPALKDNAMQMVDIDPTGHFPLITLAFSGYREVGLLQEGKTEFWNSVKNLSLDVAGTGTGAAAGAAIGTAIFPGIGTIIGGIAGAIGGRLATNAIKTQPFKDARTYHSNLLSSYQYDNKIKVRDIHGIMVQHVDCVKNDFHQNKPEFPVKIERDELYLQSAFYLKQAAEDDMRVATAYIKRAEASWFSKLGYFQRKITSAKLALANYQQMIPNDNAIQQDSATALQTLTDLPELQYGTFCKAKMEIMRSIQQSSAYIGTQTMVWCFSLAVVYRNALGNIKNELNTQAKDYMTFVEQYKSRLEASEKDLRKEADRLGLDL